jgi:hypothetical protein
MSKELWVYCTKESRGEEMEIVAGVYLGFQAGLV